MVKPTTTWTYNDPSISGNIHWLVRRKMERTEKETKAGYDRLQGENRQGDAQGRNHIPRIHPLTSTTISLLDVVEFAY